MSFSVKDVLTSGTSIRDSFSFHCLDLGSADYTLVTQISTFQMGETRACRSITIQEDTIAEVTETFTVTLTGNSEVVVNNTARMATVSIEDNDGKFENNIYNSCISNLCPECIH